jgi:hypothetical protein
MGPPRAKEAAQLRGSIASLRGEPVRPFLARLASTSRGAGSRRRQSQRAGCLRQWVDSRQLSRNAKVKDELLEVREPGELIQ